MWDAGGVKGRLYSIEYDCSFVRSCIVKVVDCTEVYEGANKTKKSKRASGKKDETEKMAGPEAGRMSKH